MRKKGGAVVFLIMGLSALIYSDTAAAETQRKSTKSQSVKAWRSIAAGAERARAPYPPVPQRFRFYRILLPA